MSFLLVGTIVLLSTVGCSKEGIPSYLMTQDEIVPVLKDLELAYAGVDQVIRDPKDRIEKYQEVNKLVLEKHQTDEAKFYKSYQWYEQHPILLDSIFQQIITELSIEIVPLQTNTPNPPNPTPLDMR